MSEDKMRADELLVKQGLASDRKEAQALIMAGMVVAGERRVDKAAELLRTASSLRLKKRRPYVSRGGEKLAGALAELHLAGDFVGAVALDIGASTGGFTDCLLQHGAQRVIALDVGHNQLDWRLRRDERVLTLEETDIRDLDPSKLPSLDWVVADVSFNSLARLAPDVVKVGGQGCRYLVMVKPQFELAAGEVPKGGVVTDAALRDKAVERVARVFVELGLHLLGTSESAVKGRRGNQEVFLYLGWSAEASSE